MTTREILTAPAAGQPVGTPWFDGIADLLLGGVQLVAGGHAYQLVEIEFYYSGGAHCDPFAHCDPIQKTCGRWYFHREEGTYRGGSFKGLDITFGADPDAFGGILIRTVRAVSSGAVTNGSSLCVDQLLASTGHASVASLDGAIGERLVDDPHSPLQLRRIPTSPNGTALPSWKTPRVGLTLKRAYQHQEMKQYIGRPYRYLTDARAVKKGRLQHILALHADGTSADQIRALTGSPARSIEDAVAQYEAGKATAITHWYGKSLKTEELCQLYGAWAAAYGG